MPRLITKRKLLLATLAAAAALALPWVGVYEDAEFSSKHLFLKHRPTAKLYFFSPVGMTDRTESYYRPDEWQEELAFRAYVNDGNGWRRSVLLYKPWWFGLSR